MSELFLRLPGFKTRVLTFSYDDGTAFDREMVKILNQYGIKCTFNLNSGVLGIHNRISEEEINSLYRGHEVAVHTFTHPHLENLDSAGIVREVMEDRKKLEAITGKLVQGMAYPYGLGEPEKVLTPLKSCGIKYARTTDSTGGFSLPKEYLQWNPTCHHTDKRINDLIDAFLTPDDTDHIWRVVPKLFYIWGHSYEFENDWEPLKNICRRLSGRENIWYAANGEIIRYLSAFKKLEFSADGNTVYNPTDCDLFGFANEANILIKAGETVRI